MTTPRESAGNQRDDRHPRDVDPRPREVAGERRHELAKRLRHECRRQPNRRADEAETEGEHRAAHPEVDDGLPPGGLPRDEAQDGRDAGCDGRE